MKAIWLVSNRRGRRGAPRLSLFPFLAVLICTMGALMLLLLLVTREARRQALRESAAKDAERQTSIASEMEMVQWRVEELKKSRKETEAQLAEARLVLGHVEEHGRRLRDQFQELSRQAKKAADEGLKAGRFLAAGKEDLRQVESQIVVAQQQLAQTQQAMANRPKSYAIIPYDGPNHTRRRPIYIECRGDAVVLQPENVVFTEADFDEPLGPGNPLAAAVRAARQQMLLEGSVDPQNAGEPYPLLLVRPTGIPAYDCALAAMKSWGSEYGYELINEDWQLNYPPPDRGVAQAVAQAVFLARQEHARLIAAAPSKYGKRPRQGSYRSPTGDMASEQGRGGEAESPGFYSSKPANRYGEAAAADTGSSTGRRGRGSGNFGSGDGEGQGGSGGSGGAPGGSGGPSGDAEFVANNPYASLALPGAGGSAGGSSVGSPGGTGYGPGGGNSTGGSSVSAGLGNIGNGVASFDSGEYLPGGAAGMGNGSSYGAGGGIGGGPGSGVPGGAPACAGRGRNGNRLRLWSGRPSRWHDRFPGRGRRWNGKRRGVRASQWYRWRAGVWCFGWRSWRAGRRRRRNGKWPRLWSGRRAGRRFRGRNGGRHAQFTGGQSWWHGRCFDLRISGRLRWQPGMYCCRWAGRFAVHGFLRQSIREPAQRPTDRRFGERGRSHSSRRLHQWPAAGRNPSARACQT